MSQNKRALLIVGSPRCEKSNSEAIGTYLMERLGEKGVVWDKVYTYRLTRTAEGREKLLNAVYGADILVLASPLYVDSIPSFTINAMELINEHRRAIESPKEQKLFVIVNCGFPEPSHNQTALAIYRRFALESGIEWVGGAHVGWGMAIDGRSLDSVGGMVKNLMRGLQLAAGALAGDIPVPKEAEELISRPFMPLVLAKLMTSVAGGVGWNSEARKNGVRNRMHDRPYESD
ncbi:MAG: NAD(P)H-dependent oxidoreductase [Halobacteriota archaeon]